MLLCSLSTTFILPGCWARTVFCPDYAPLYNQTSPSKCVTYIYRRLDITFHFLFLSWANYIPLSTKAHNSLSPVFQWKRSPEQFIHRLYYNLLLNKFNLEHNEKCIFILVSESLCKIYTVEVIFPCPSMKMGQAPCLFSLFLVYILAIILRTNTVTIN